MEAWCVLMNSMDRAFYDVKFDLQFQEKTRNEFQDFFNTIMTARFPGDFISTRTWGQMGDQKCDGYILSTGTFYQVYAPDEMNAENAIKKMKDDFSGALEKWGEKIKKWIFVHNARKGVPPHIIQQLTDFKKNYPEIEFFHMGKAELKKELFTLNDPAISQVLGSIPTYQDVNGLTIEAIMKTVVEISKTNSTTPSVIEPVSQRKLDANGLSDYSKQLFETGMIKSKLVSDFFRKWHDAKLEEDTAAELHNIYETAAKEYIDSDDVFQRILSTICGTEFGNPANMVSALTVMAYFFQTCDIFENPREEGEE